MLAIFVASGESRLPDLPGGMSDKTAHFLAYGGLGALALRATSGARWSGVTTSSALVAWAICIVYAASDEMHQWFVPGRTAAVDDWIADVAGSGLMIALLAIVARRRRVR